MAQPRQIRAIGNVLAGGIVAGQIAGARGQLVEARESGFGSGSIGGGGLFGDGPHPFQPQQPAQFLAVRRHRSSRR